MVAHLLKDADDNSWYEDMPTHIGPYHNDPRASYNGFLQFLSNAKEEYLLHVHTLNHDLFFESFNRTDYINGDISDGFDDFGSRYYGKLHVEGCDCAVWKDTLDGIMENRYDSTSCMGALIMR